MTVRNPWPGQQAEVVNGTTGTVVVAPTGASTFGVPVVAGQSYLVQRPTAPATTLPFAQVTGDAGRIYKQLGNVAIGLSGNSLPGGNTVSVTNPGNQAGTLGAAGRPAGTRDGLSPGAGPDLETSTPAALHALTALSPSTRPTAESATIGKPR